MLQILFIILAACAVIGFIYEAARGSYKDAPTAVGAFIGAAALTTLYTIAATMPNSKFAFVMGILAAVFRGLGFAINTCMVRPFRIVTNLTLMILMIIALV